MQLLVLLAVAACSEGCGRLGVPQGWSAATIEGDTLYIGTMEGDVRALDVATGATKCTYVLESEDDNKRAIYGKPAVAGDRLYIGGYDGMMYALPLECETAWDNGDEDWKQSVGDARPPEPIVGSPVFVPESELVLIGSSDGNLYALDGEEGFELWRFPTGDKIWGTPTMQDGVAYFGSLDHSVYAVTVDRESAQLLWRFPVNGGVSAAPVVADGRVYVGAFDSIFYAVDAQSGEEVWRFDGSRKWFWGAAVATEDTVYVAALDGILYALDAADGEPRWQLNTEEPIIGSPVIVGEWIVIGPLDGRVRAVKTSDPETEKQCNIRKTLRSSLTASQDGVVYFGATDHSVRALRVLGHSRKPDGSFDEEWVHFSNQDPPLSVGRIPDC